MTFFIIIEQKFCFHFYFNQIIFPIIDKINETFKKFTK